MLTVMARTVFTATRVDAPFAAIPAATPAALRRKRGILSLLARRRADRPA